MKYFGHDCNAGDDPKLVKVRMKYSIAGYGIYFRCNEFIGSKITETYEACILEPDLEIMSYDFNLAPEKIKEILDYFVEVGLFDKTTEGKYRNLKLLERLDEYHKRQKAKRLRSESVLTTHKVGTVSGYSRDSVGTKEKKRKESKVKEIKVSNFKGFKPKRLANMEKTQEQTDKRVSVPTGSK